MASDLAKVKSAVGAGVGERLGGVVEIAVVIINVLFGWSSTMAPDFTELAKVDSSIRIRVGGS